MPHSGPEIPRVSAREKLAIVAVVLIAAGVRLWDLPRLELSHFDEGVYAYWGQEALGLPWQYPYRELYSPPLFPKLVGLSYLIVGRSGPAAVLPSALLGVATVAALWWLGRRVFSPTVGLLGALLLALSDLHITYSRAALVDVSLTFLLVLAVLCFCEMLRSGSWVWTVGAGLATGLAWNTKYNGFLPVVAAVMTVAWAVLRTRGLKRDGAVPERVAVAAVIALACYVPWFLHVDAALKDGYSQLLAHQAGYIGGLGAWRPGAAHQLRCWHVFRLWGTALVSVGLLAGAGVALVRRRVFLASVAVLLAAIAAGIGLDYIWLAAAVAWMWEARRDRTEPGRLLAVWTGLLIVLTPMYTPYTRLAVPLVPMMALLAAAFAVRQVQGLLERDPDDVPPDARAWLLGAVAGGLLLFVASGQVMRLNFPGLWQAALERGGYADAGRWADQHTPTDAVVRYHAQPTVAFYTPRQLEPTTDTDLLASVPPRPTYLVVDFLIDSHPTARASLARAGAPVATIPNRPALPALLDHLGPARFWWYLDGRMPQFQQIRIYRIGKQRPPNG